MCNLQEQAYPRPKYLVSTTFAIVTVLLGYSGVSSTGEIIRKPHLNTSDGGVIVIPSVCQTCAACTQRRDYTIAATFHCDSNDNMRGIR